MFPIAEDIHLPLAGFVCLFMASIMTQSVGLFHNIQRRKAGPFVDDELERIRREDFVI
jgi:hypothetical protein